MGPRWREAWQCPWGGTQGLRGLGGHGKRGTGGISAVGAGGALRLAEKRKGDPGKQCETTGVNWQKKSALKGPTYFILTKVEIRNFYMNTSIQRQMAAQLYFIMSVFTEILFFGDDLLMTSSKISFKTRPQ